MGTYSKCVESQYKFIVVALFYYKILVTNSLLVLCVNDVQSQNKL